VTLTVATIGQLERADRHLQRSRRPGICPQAVNLELLLEPHVRVLLLDDNGVQRQISRWRTRTHAAVPESEEPEGEPGEAQGVVWPRGEHSDSGLLLT
jgi:hypothetical protein